MYRYRPNSRRGSSTTGRGNGSPWPRGMSHSSSDRGSCVHFRRGRCKFGGTCKFSHDRDPKEDQRNRVVEESFEQIIARATYNAWRSLIRRPPSGNDLQMMQILWTDALEILNGDDRDCRQALPRDLDNEEDFFGRRHIGVLLEYCAQPSQYKQFIKILQSFLAVITHTALIDCLSVDTYIGSLYNFISGSNGNRGIPFFKHICDILVANQNETGQTIPPDDVASTLVAATVALCELLRREPRARYHTEIPCLVTSIDTVGELICKGDSSFVSSTIAARTADLHAIVNRACDLLSVDCATAPLLLSVTHSIYPREIIRPGGSHDNDQADITKIVIFPTQAEILYDGKEFLPSTVPEEPHFLEHGPERHIDTQFRLLRHDTFGKLKPDLRSLMMEVMEDKNHLTSSKLGFRDTRTYKYANAFVKFLHLNRYGELQAQVSFTQPQAFYKGQKVDKRKWWEDSRRLEEGVLLSLIWMHESNLKHHFLIVAGRSTDPKDEQSLTHNDRIATVAVKLATQDQSAVEALLNLSSQKVHGILLEFPNILPATFVPVLSNLQRMQRLSRLPFRNWIIPACADDASTPRLEVPPPLYTRRAGFTFSLDPILQSGAESMSLAPLHPPDEAQFIPELEKATGLDRGQCLALIAALCLEFAMIQGPPGTGKSYLGVQLMRVLLAARSKADLGPIIVVCFTNHALDQFLEDLLENRIRKIIRVGGQCRSELLEGHNLRKVTQAETKSRHERWQAATAYQKLEECQTMSKRVLARLHVSRKRIEWRYFRHHLAHKYARIYSQFDRVDNEGYTTVGRASFEMWAGDCTGDTHISATNAESLDVSSTIERASRSVDALSYIERRFLIDLWIGEIQEDASTQFFEIIHDAENVQRDLINVHEETNRRVLQEADVIGLTTSGLAKHISTLQHVKAKVVICEEAGEVMEPHIISALLPTIEHFIQIGDHQQLRPSINNFEDLSLESKQGVRFQLDRSQFERLSVGERGRPPMPVAQLNVQRRMRPDISDLIRETVYPKLRDHSSTLLLPDVVGMRKNLFWLQHDNLEAGNESEIHHKQSKSNDWEVAMVHALVRHMVRQGIYASSDIAVLTPYTGQLQKLRSVMRNDFEIVLSERDKDSLVKDGFNLEEPPEDEGPAKHGSQRQPLEKKKLSDLLRIATVDNFQGEEAKIVIVSLVRSNKERRVGFLKTVNRINVLLSRAQHGMYLVGNTDTYSNVPMWQKIVDMLSSKDCVGPSLDLRCPRHMNTAIEIRQPDDFAKYSPEGGCREACRDRLPDCGHRCQARCHSKAMHEVFRCEKPCQRLLEPCGHACQKATCGEDCGRCKVVLNGVPLPCGHSKNNVHCYLTINVEAILCDIIVDKTISKCGHVVKVSCYQDVDEETYRCPSPCSTILSCGHACPGTCGRCNVMNLQRNPAVEHPKCTKVCGRRFATCNHVCPKRCHDGSDCGLCTKKCKVACVHSQCTLQCHEACAPCIERCQWSCPHQGDCTLPCSAPCNRLPCDERCTDLLPCGHQCPGICGEKCLGEFCQACGKDLDAQVDMFEFKTYSEIDLNETPVVALGCGHFFTAQTLDGMIGLDQAYTLHPGSGKISGLKDDCGAMTPIIPRCPHCQIPIRQHVTQRYNRLINGAVIDEMSKRFIVTGQTDLQEINKSLVGIHRDLENTLPQVTNTPIAMDIPKALERGMRDITLKLQKRYKACMQLRISATKLQRRAAERHQPARKLHEAILHSMRRDSTLESTMQALRMQDPPLPDSCDHRITHGAILLQIKIDCMILEDKFSIFSQLKVKYGTTAAHSILADKSPVLASEHYLEICADFIATCVEVSLPRSAVEASLYYVRIAHLFKTCGFQEPTDRETAGKYHETAKRLLERAKELCEQKFRDADSLLLAVVDALDLLGREWYEDVTADELAMIKQAMISGSHGIATHSGHWYKCIKGHPFAIGECGMPMELARCPECGEKIGGQGHVAVQGVTRAEDMET